MSSRKQPNPKIKQYPIVGRSTSIDLSKYLININGREIVDYDKLKKLKPDVYNKILEEEQDDDLDESLFP